MKIAVDAIADDTKKPNYYSCLKHFFAFIAASPITTFLALADHLPGGVGR
jgi:hypothetical protein